MEFKYFGVKFQILALTDLYFICKVIFILFVFSPNANAQNLVPNSGFEIFKKCPEDYITRYRKELIPGWYMPTLGTADYFNMCAKIRVGVPKNFMGYCLPKDGVAYSGLILLLEPPVEPAKEKPENYREYLQTEFTQELQKDNVYEVTVYYSIASYSTFAINRLGIYISKDKIGNKSSTGVLKYIPQITSDSLLIEWEHDKWHCLQGKYKALGGEKYITIGNFYDDYKTAYRLCDFTGISSVKKSTILKDQIAYYYFDHISVSELKCKK